jgi:hypothetical protein
MWEIETSLQWEKDRKFYEKKRPRELAAVLRNLDRYQKMLLGAPNSKTVQAGFLHSEPSRVVAIDQKGGGAALQETRLYTYADDKNKILYIITVGNKDEQQDDISFAKDFVSNLFNSDATDEYGEETEDRR